MSNTKFVVVKLKEVILTAAFVFLSIVILLVIVALVSTKNETPTGILNSDAASSETSGLYYPGVYTSSVTLNDTTIHLEVVCDSNHINSVRLVNLDDAVETMYPLLNPALEDLELQLSKDIPLEELTLTEGSQYTQGLLIEAIETTLKKAEITK